MNQLGITKLMDGLFICDQSLLTDFQFLISNKVSHIIQWGTQINQQVFQNQNIKIINYVKNQSYNLFPQFEQFNKIYQFVEQAKQQCLCCLISSNIQSQAALMIIPYIMKRFSWDLKTILDFLNFKCSFFNPRVQLVQQLMDYQIYLIENNKQINLKSIQFKYQFMAKIITDDTDYLILLNTIKNTLLQTNVFSQQKKNYNQRRKRVQWIDRLRPSSSLASFNNNKYMVYNRNSTIKSIKKQNIAEKGTIKTLQIAFTIQKKAQKNNNVSHKNPQGVLKNIQNNGSDFMIDDIEFQSIKQLSRTKIFKGSLKKRGSLRIVRPDKKPQKQNIQNKVTSMKKLVTQFKNQNFSNLSKKDNFFSNIKIASKVKIGSLGLTA